MNNLKITISGRVSLDELGIELFVVNNKSDHLTFLRTSEIETSAFRFLDGEEDKYVRANWRSEMEIPPMENGVLIFKAKIKKMVENPDCRMLYLCVFDWNNDTCLVEYEYERF